MKIFHTADLHIGMKFNNYPEPIRSLLKQARIDVLGKMVSIANQQECNIFAVAGDLFDNINGNTKKTIGEVVNTLKGFHGECVLVLPGNHDYDNNMVELWKNFREMAQDNHNIVFINQEQPVSLLDWDLDAVIYPAPCHSKHSDVNNIGWIKELNSKTKAAAENVTADINKDTDSDTDLDPIRIGIAHGALEGISPDLDGTYYNMSLAELEAAPVDVWLLGHTHITYPDSDSDKKKVSGWKVFNPGTPEPDGLDCKHSGNAWIITIDDTKAGNSVTKAAVRNHKEISGELITTGSYRFKDQRHTVRNKADFEKIVKDLLNRDLLKGDVPKGDIPNGDVSKADLINGDPRNTIARLRIKGKLDEETFNYRHEVRRKLEDALACLIFDDSEVAIKITSEMIHKEFSDGSFPSMLLSALTDDEEALQLAYEMILEVKR